MRLTILPLVAAAMLSLAGGAMAQEAQMVPGNIRAIKVDGTAWQTIGNQGQRERLKEGDFLRQGNSIETAADGSVILLFDNGSNMTLRPNTKFSIDKFLRDPFDAEGIDYKNLKSEPSRSVTKVKVREGTILFDLPKLKISKGSSCDISNPVGTAGIRGTAGWVDENSMGCSEGSFQSTTQSGQSQTLAAGQSTSISPQGNFGPPPNNANQNMQEAQKNSQSLPQNIPTDAFAGAPQSQSGAQSNLTPEQQESIEQAAQEGQEAVVEAVKQIAAETPEAAAAAAAAAAALVPDAAPQIAAAAAAAVPQNQAASLAPQIAAAVAEVAQSAAPQVAAAVAGAVTSAAPQIAAAVAGAVNNAAPQIAAAVAQVVPDSAPAVAGAVAGVVPTQATAIAQSVAQAAPSQANNIATAVNNAAPDAGAAAVTHAAEQGAQQANQ
ncbi:MAG: hypothetical protein ACKOD5_14035, partial [Chthoniobacterales bacterium]